MKDCLVKTLKATISGDFEILGQATFSLHADGETSTGNRTLVTQIISGSQCLLTTPNDYPVTAAAASVQVDENNVYLQHSTDSNDGRAVLTAGVYDFTVDNKYAIQVFTNKASSRTAVISPNIARNKNLLGLTNLIVVLSVLNETFSVKELCEFSPNVTYIDFDALANDSDNKMYGDIADMAELQSLGYFKLRGASSYTKLFGNIEELVKRCCNSGRIDGHLQLDVYKTGCKFYGNVGTSYQQIYINFTSTGATIKDKNNTTTVATYVKSTDTWTYEYE